MHLFEICTFFINQQSCPLSIFKITLVALLLNFFQFLQFSASKMKKMSKKSY
jgi:hypothetical protein